MPSAVTNDSNNRAILTVNVTPFVGGANWSASVLDNNPSFGGFGDSGASWTITVGGITVASASNQSYDFGANSPPRYFPRSESGTVSLGPGNYTATGTFTTTGLVGTASLSFGFTVPSPPAPTTPVWSTGTSLTAAVRNRSVSRTVVASPVTSYQLISSSGADGLTLNTSTGVISGTPTVFGTASLTIRAFNSTSSADRTFTMVILSTPPRVWTTSFIDGLLQVWNGSSWIRGRIRVWNGSAWIDSK